MTKEQLLELIEAIRQGEQEDALVDWKRAFWKFEQKESKSQFIKDVAAMANSIHSSNVARRIIVGLDTSGNLHNAPFPGDEAHLQQLLRHAITPEPNIAWVRHEIEGKTLWVLLVEPPFDRPYVAKRNDRYSIPVRKGSTTGTASRSLLDRWYRSAEGLADLELEWLLQPTVQEKFGDEFSPTPIERLELTRPPQVISETRRKIEGDLESARDALPRATAHGYQEDLAAYEKRCERFIAMLEDPESVDDWYALDGADYLNAPRASVLVHNTGSQPATGVRVRVDTPSWLAVFEVGDRPESKVRMPARPRMVQPTAEERLRHAVLTNFPDINDLIYHPSKPNQTEGEASFKKRWFRLKKEQLDHGFSMGRSIVFEFIVLPSAPPDVSEFELRASIYCREWPDWRVRSLFASLRDSVLPAGPGSPDREPD